MPVETRPFGPDTTPVSLLGFGCRAVGGLMVRGTVADQERAVARALEVGINYFDTAVQYGDGTSEQHLGHILRRLGANDALVGTKVRLRSAEFGSIAATVTASLDASLRRLQRDHVDIFHLHNAITTAGDGESLSVRQVLEEVVPAFQALCASGSGGGIRAKPVDDHSKSAGGKRGPVDAEHHEQLAAGGRHGTADAAAWVRRHH